MYADNQKLDDYNGLTQSIGAMLRREHKDSASLNHERKIQLEWEAEDRRIAALTPTTPAPTNGIIGGE